MPEKMKIANGNDDNNNVGNDYGCRNEDKYEAYKIDLD
jgi:hypothetical protein